jgi:hypothetical protein
MSRLENKARPTLVEIIDGTKGNNIVDVGNTAVIVPVTRGGNASRPIVHLRPTVPVLLDMADCGPHD